MQSLGGSLRSQVDGHPCRRNRDRKNGGGHVAREAHRSGRARDRSSADGNPAAHQLYLKGRDFWNKRTDEGLRNSIDYFNQAVEKDPNYALAYTGIADSYDVLFFYSAVRIRPKEVFPKAKRATLKALAIDNTLAEAHNALAYALFEYYWDFAGLKYPIMACA